MSLSRQRPTSLLTMAGQCACCEKEASLFEQPRGILELDVLYDAQALAQSPGCGFLRSPFGSLKSLTHAVPNTLPPAASISAMRKRTYPSSRSRNLSGNCFNARSRAMWCVTKSARWPDGSSNALNAMASTNSTVLWARRVASSPSMGSSLSSLNRTGPLKGAVVTPQRSWFAPRRQFGSLRSRCMWGTSAPSMAVGWRAACIRGEGTTTVAYTTQTDDVRP